MFRRRAIRKKLLIIIPLFIITGYHVLIQEFIRLKKLEIEKKDESILRQSIYSNKLIKILEQIDNLFLIDIDHFEKLKNNKDQLKNYSNNNNFHVFGIHENNIHLIQKKNEEIKILGCILTEKNGVLRDKTVPTIFYINCKNEAIIIQISIFYKRGEFYWIGDDKSKTSQTRYFGDTPRAMNYFILANKTIDINSSRFSFPSDIVQFIFDYKYSKFIECSRKNISEAKKRYETGIHALKISKIKSGLIYIKSVFEEFKKPYWLAAGTYLGWFRDCSIIPHTQDVDFAMWNHDYDDRLLEKFRGNEILHVYQTLGLIREAFELRTIHSRFTFDIFLVYKLNETYQWNGYQGNRQLFRQFLPYFNDSNLCSGELLDNKFLLPCNPEHYLKVQYGDNWDKPLENHYLNSKTFIFHKKWNDEEYPYTIRSFNQSGAVDVVWTLKQLNWNSKINYKKLPRGEI